MTEQRDNAAERQKAALAAGRQAEAEGRTVIYIHGRPYIDPGAAEEPPAPSESPWPWDIWDDGHP